MPDSSSTLARSPRRPGTAPGTLIAHPGAHPTQITVTVYGAVPLQTHAALSVDALAALRTPGAKLWIAVTGLADIPTIQSIGTLLGLHSLAMEDVLNTHQRSKVEAYEAALFLVTKLPSTQNPQKPQQFSLFLGPDYVLTFCELPNDSFTAVAERLRNPHSRLHQMGVDYLAYALLDTLIDHYYPVLETFGETVSRLEESIIERPRKNHLERLHQTKRALMHLRRAIWPLRDMMNGLIRDESPFISPTTHVYLRDCYDHCVQLIDIVETYREIASGLLDIYLSSMTARLNEVMKVLTIISTIFIPLSFLASLWGMNFDRSSPWNMPELGWLYGYPMALGLMGALALALLIAFYRKGWLN